MFTVEMMKVLKCLLHTSHLQAIALDSVDPNFHNIDHIYMVTSSIIVCI